MPGHLFFYVGLSFIFLHEMDAIRCREWRIFPGLSLLNERLGFIVFMWAHLPLFFFIFWQLTQNPNPDYFIKGFDIFLIVHLLLHLLYLRHKNNEFNDWISWSIITGAAIFGLLDLISL